MRMPIAPPVTSCDFFVAFARDVQGVLVTLASLEHARQLDGGRFVGVRAA